MGKLNAIIEKKVAPLANRLSRQKYLQVIQNVFLAMVPLFTIGSFSLVITSPPMDYKTMEPGVICSIMRGWQALSDFTGPVLNLLFEITMPFMALYVAMGIGYFLAKHYKMNTFVPVIITTASFVISTGLNDEGKVTFVNFDATGLFAAILVSIVTFEVYRFLSEKKIGRINLEGGGVPPALADSIGNLVPIMVVLLGISIVSNSIIALTGGAVPEARTFAYASWNMFAPIAALIDTLDVKALILVLVLIVIDILIYLPFFKVYEKQKLKEEATP